MPSFEYSPTELDTDWIHPWIWLDWVDLWEELHGLDWIGLGQMTANSLETEIFRLEAGLVKQTLKKLKYSQCV